LRNALGEDIVSSMPSTVAPGSRSEALPQRRCTRHPVRLGEGRPTRNRERGEGRTESHVQSSALPRILSGLQVLIVDDDHDILELFTLALTTCGAKVSTADNARDALALATRARPHVIVSDIAMVGEDGYWLVGRLRELPPDAAPNVPVIAATAYGREHSRERVLAAGFTEHLQKPIDPETLCRLVAKLAGR
jgi:CheY-like chemotaxis protein